MNEIDHDEERRYEDRKDELRAAYLRKHNLFACPVCDSEVSFLMYNEEMAESICFDCNEVKE